MKEWADRAVEAESGWLNGENRLYICFIRRVGDLWRSSYCQTRSWSEHVCVCVPSCVVQSFYCDVWSFVCVLNCLDWSIFVSCWPFLPSTFVSSPSSPPSSPVSLHMFTCFVLSFTTVFFITERSPILQILDTHTLSRRQDAVRQRNTSIFLVFFPSSVRSVIIPSVFPRFCDFLLSFLLFSSHHYSYIRTFCLLALLSPSVLSFVLLFTLKLLINMLGSFPSSWIDPIRTSIFGKWQTIINLR